jgi:hypothetical protein
MAFKQRVYIAGPRMGQNNTMNGMDASLLKKKPKRQNSTKSSRKKK